MSDNMPVMAIELPVDPMTKERTRRFATQCLVCNTPLCDATSVEVGVGPTCRKRAGMKGNAAVNALTAAAAILAEDGKVAEVLEIAEQCKALGFPKVADAVYKRFVDIRIEKQADGMLLVKTPYSDTWNTVMYQTRIGKWNRELKGRVVDPARKQDLWAALRQVYPGQHGLDCEGRVFLIPALKAAA